VKISDIIGGVRKPLKARDFDLNLDSVGVNTINPLSGQGSYYCDVCKCQLRDSSNYLDHMNGKSHQRNLGMSMTSERSSLEQIKERLKAGTKRKEPEESESELDKYVKKQEEIEKIKQQRKEDKKEQKRKKKEEKQKEEEPVNPELAKLGFTSFGSSKKKN